MAIAANASQSAVLVSVVSPRRMNVRQARRHEGVATDLAASAVAVMVFPGVERRFSA